LPPKEPRFFETCPPRLDCLKARSQRHLRQANLLLLLHIANRERAVESLGEGSIVFLLPADSIGEIGRMHHDCWRNRGPALIIRAPLGPPRGDEPLRFNQANMYGTIKVFDPLG